MPMPTGGDRPSGRRKRRGPAVIVDMEVNLARYGAYHRYPGRRCAAYGPLPVDGGTGARRGLLAAAKRHAAAFICRWTAETGNPALEFLTATRSTCAVSAGSYDCIPELLAAIRCRLIWAWRDQQAGALAGPGSRCLGAERVPGYAIWSDHGPAARSRASCYWPVASRYHPSRARSIGDDLCDINPAATPGLRDRAVPWP